MSEWLGHFIGDWHALLVLLIAGFLPNEVWRMVGLWLGAGVDEGSELLVWVRRWRLRSSPVSSRRF